MENENSNVITNEEVTTNVSTNSIPNITNKGNTKNIIAITAIIILFLGLLFVTFSYFNSPKKRLVGIINKVYGALVDNESNKKISEILSNSIVGLEGETTLNLSGSIVEEEFMKIEDSVIKYSYIEDNKNKKSSFELDSSVNNDKFINVYGLLKDNKLYFNLKNIINKYYHTEIEFVELKSIMDNGEDAKYILNIFKDTIIESLDSDDFTKTKTTIKIGDKSEKVEKMSFNFTDKYMLDVIVSFMKKIKTDDKALNILLDISENITKEEILEEIDYLIESSKEVKATEDFEFNMYVKDYMTTVKYEFVVDTAKIAYYDYKDIKEFTMSEGETNYLEMKIENNKNISGTIAMMIPFTGTYEDGTLNLKVNLMGAGCDLTIGSKESISKDSIETNLLFKLNVVQAWKEYLNLSIDSKNSISKFDKINELNISNSTHVDDISESDQETIINNIRKLPVISEMITVMDNNIQDSLEISGTEDYITF